MAKGKPPTGAKLGSPDARRAPQGGVDLELVRELARIATELDLAEVEADGAGRVRIVRRTDAGHDAQVAAGERQARTAAPLSFVPAATAEAEAGGEGMGVIASPFVGTFYRAASPEVPAFVEVGQTVRKGQVVCIVEAMKLMNEIESDFEGKVREVLVKNGEHVEYGRALFRIEKTA